jgi:hypothetical protein
VHTLFGHIFLRQNDGELFGAVVAVVEEDDDVALFDAAVDCGVDNRFDELIGYSFVVDSCMA